MQEEEQDQVRFTRAEFYERLWTRPATTLAAELGCSDVMICKICKTHQIPKPWPGYWAQVQHGTAPEKTPLPQSSEPELQVVFNRKREHATVANLPQPEPTFDLDIQQILERARQLSPIVVAKSLHRPHHLIEITRDRIRANRKHYSDQTEIELGDRRPMLDIAVGEEQTARALRIMDALIKRVEEIGGTVEIRNHVWYEHKKRTVVCFAGEEVQQIRIREKLRKVQLPPDKRSWRDSELQPSGILVLDGGPGCFDEEFLRDTQKKQQIEEGLNGLIIRFIKQAGQLRIERREAETERRRQEEEERIRRQREEELTRRREELASRQKKEQSKVDELVRRANAWQLSRVIRRFLKAQYRVLAARYGSVSTDGEIADYLAWASQQANRLDPLVPSPHSVLDERI